MKLTTKLLLNFSLVGLTMIFTGCSDDGAAGAIGATGAAGVAGQAGISCWDLNEDGVKSMPDEDTNKDGHINVMDCRAIPSSPAVVTIDVNQTTGASVNQHTRTAYSNFVDSPNRIDLYTGTAGDYISAVYSGDLASLDQFVPNPTPDPCGLWEWYTESSGNQIFTAKDVVGYSTMHYPVRVIDSNLTLHHGADNCRLACQADSQCVAAAYMIENTLRSNTLICTLGYKVDFDITTSSELKALEGYNPGVIVANMEQTGGTLAGIVSVCENPVVP